MTALLTADEAAWLVAGERLVIVRAGDAWEPCSRCGGHGMVDYGGSIGECSSCGGNTVQRVQGDKGRFAHRAPQAWVALTGPCPSQTKHSDDGRLLVAYDSYDEPLYGDLCPDCRDGRRIVPLYTKCPKCHGDYSYRCCEHCQNGRERVGRGSIEVVPVVRDIDDIPTTGAAIEVDPSDGALLYLAGVDAPEDAIHLNLDPLPRPGVDFGIIIDCVEVAT